MKTSPQIFKDEASFKAAYGYDAADVDKRNLMDAFWKANNPTDEAGIYNVLKS